LLFLLLRLCRFCFRLNAASEQTLLLALALRIRFRLNGGFGAVFRLNPFGFAAPSLFFRKERLPLFITGRLKIVGSNLVVTLPSDFRLLFVFLFRRRFRFLFRLPCILRLLLSFLEFPVIMSELW
jgi:hypothetical protein